MKTDGILLVDKPIGWSSHDVVAKVRNILKKEAGQKIKVGHTGTLDPMATGLLILVVGSYTKRASEFSKMDKTYEVEMTLGQTSSTGDSEGKLIEVSDKKPSAQDVVGVVNKFIGDNEQIPPAYSAIKVGGQRAYKLARAGKVVKLEPRKIKIYTISDIKYRFPLLCFTTKVSSGTYIRSFVSDIGELLGTGAFLSNLRRTTVGEYNINHAVTLGEINGDSLTMID